MTMLRRLGGLAVLGTFALSSASAYYHYLHYNGIGTPVPDKFDLTQLPNKTVTFFVSDAGPTQYPQNDSFPSVLSQIRQAIQTWNGIDTSDLRVAFGGLNNASTPAASTPGGQVVFEELPPGFLGFGGPTSSPSPSAGGDFYPILQGVVHLTNDLNKKPGPSYTDSFLLTAVHEMGHSLGLQHTFTSSAMSTAVTRATSLTKPIDADDIAGLSVLYPSATFGTQTGTITGRITANGRGVHMASVVAIRNGFGAVSALTNQDGTYRMDGVPPGQYYLYAHPIPPQSSSSCTDICAPLDALNKPVQPGAPFNTALYPGTTSILQAITIGVAAGSTVSNIDMSVQPRSDVPIYGISIYSFFAPNPNPVSPGYLNITPAGYGGIKAGGTGIQANGPATSVQVMGGGANIYYVQPYVDANTFSYLNIGVQYNPASTGGPQHLIFSQGSFIYILPGGLNLVQKAPPQVNSATANPDGTVAIAGSGFGQDSLIYFDGLPAAIRSLDDQNGKAVVAPPPGASGQRATVSVFNHDGQNSLFLQSSAPVTYTYDVASPPSIALSPSSLPSGTEAAIDITGVNTRFATGQTIVGFGTPDVFVRNVFVLSPTHLLVNVSIPAGATRGTSEVTVISGFQAAAQPSSFTILPATQQPATIPVLQNIVPGQTGAYPGALVSFSGLNLEATGMLPTVTLNSEPVPVLSASSTAVTLQLPVGLSSGPVLLALNNGSANSFPVAVGIDPPAPTITLAENPANVVYDSSHPVHAGDVVDLLVTGLDDPSAVIFPSRVTVKAGGVVHSAIAVFLDSSGLFRVRFVLSDLVASGSQVPVIVYLDGRSSLPVAVGIAN